MNLATMTPRELSYTWFMWSRATRADARRITRRDDRSAYAILASMACFTINRAAWAHSQSDQARFCYMHSMRLDLERIPSDIAARFGMVLP